MTDFVSGLRGAMQDLLFPEFRALQTEVRGLNERLDRFSAETARRFDRVDQRFERVDEHFAWGHDEIMALTKQMATMDGKLDILVGHMVDFKEATRLSLRVEQVEKPVGEIDENVRALMRPGRPG